MMMMATNLRLVQFSGVTVRTRSARVRSDTNSFSLSAGGPLNGSRRALIMMEAGCCSLLLCCLIPTRNQLLRFILMVRNRRERSLAEAVTFSPESGTDSIFEKKLVLCCAIKYTDETSIVIMKMVKEPKKKRKMPNHQGDPRRRRLILFAVVRVEQRLARL